MDLEDLWTPVSPRTLREVVDRLCEAGHVVADAPVDDRRVITGVCQDSRRVRPGDLYAALPGRRHHGADFASEATARGAVAMLSDRPSDIVPTVVVDDPRVALGPLAAWAYGNPSTAFDLYGVTGTNGKTSTVYLLEAALVAAGLRTGVVTGVTVRGPGTVRPATRTTPEACELQQSFVEFVEEGVDAVAMEVSSHGLAEHRIDGSRFDVGVFTNLARDHLDYHPDMEAYYAAKARLFERDLCERAAVCIDDDYGRRLAGEVAVPHLTFSARDPGADVYATTVRAQRWGARSLCTTGANGYRFGCGSSAGTRWTMLSRPSLRCPSEESSSALPWPGSRHSTRSPGGSSVWTSGNRSSRWSTTYTTPPVSIGCSPICVR